MLTPTTSRPFSPARAVAFLWRTDRPLTAVGLLMLPILAAALVGLAVDPRVITGAPAWLKPAKFAISIAIYSLTLAWIFSYLPEWRRTRRWVGWTSAVVFVIEIAIIGGQAWRGTTSHFNVGTPLDATLFGIMGAAIVIQTVMSLFVVIALWRTRFDDELIGWALRAGMAITLAGATTGGMMTRPTTAQIAEARATHRMPFSGAHTVGAPDGGPGLPGTGWSQEHGDVRVPHFIGLHAVQALVLMAIALRRRQPRAATGRTMKVLGASYAALYVILLWQALRGEPLAGPGPATIEALIGWAAATAAGWLWVGRGSSMKTVAPVFIA